MKTEERIEKQRELIEEVGRFFDREGLQPVAGRIIGLLMVMDKELYTFEEITEELSISKSSASIALRNLEIRGAIEYITIPGDRKRYFRSRIKDPFSMIDQFAARMIMFQEMASRILELKADKKTRNATFLSEMSHMLEFFTAQIDQLKRQYIQKYHTDN